MAANTLCPEILDMIFSFLPTQDLCTASVVCSAWSQVAKLSFRRRINFELFYAVRVSMKIREFESYAQIHPHLFSDEALTIFQLSSILSVSLPERSHSLPILAVLAMKPEWCQGVTKLEFNSNVSVEDWNLFGSRVLCKFPNLKQLCLNDLILLPERVSQVQDADNAAVCSSKSEAGTEIRTSNPFPTLSGQELSKENRQYELKGYLCLTITKKEATEISATLSIRKNKNTNKNNLVLASSALESEWCDKINQLDFECQVELEHWNTFGAWVLRRFPNLNRLQLREMVWCPKSLPNKGDDARRSVVEFGDQYLHIDQPNHATGEYERYGEMSLYAWNRPINATWKLVAEMPDLNGVLQIRVLEQPLIAATTLASEWCDKITSLHFADECQVAIEDLNAVGSSLLNRFPKLMYLTFPKLVGFMSSTGSNFGQMRLAVPVKSGTLAQPDPSRLELEGSLFFKAGYYEPLLAAVAISDEWCSRISKLELQYNDIVLQDWNAAGEFLTNKFSSLKELNVILTWRPGYVSTIKFEGDHMVRTPEVEQDVSDSSEKQDSTEDPPESKWAQAFLALTSLNKESCSKITELRFRNNLAVQDWNVAGSDVLSKFPKLKALTVHLKWDPDYTSTFGIQNNRAQIGTSEFESIRIAVEKHFQCDRGFRFGTPDLSVTFKRNFDPSGDFCVTNWEACSFGRSWS